MTKRKRRANGRAKPREIPRALRPYWLARFYGCNPADFLKLSAAEVDLHIRKTRNLFAVWKKEVRRGRVPPR